jgi:hypothetical protein
MRTAEQARAFAQLRALAAIHDYRVTVDAEGFPIIPGRYGQIEWTGGSDLAVYSRRPRLFQKLWAIAGVRQHQTGDTEMRAVFPPEALEQVAGVIKARRKRSLAPDEARRRGFKPAPKPTLRASSGR